MRMLLLTAALWSLWIAQSRAAEPADAATEIPLEDIWALDMPGTRDVRELDGSQADDSTVRRIKMSLNVPAKKDSSLGIAFPGTALDALTAADALLSQKSVPPKAIPAGSEVTILFFSRSFNYYVHLKSVQVKPGVITISYVFVPHKTKYLTAHFALIPLGQLAPGEWNVDIVQAPMDAKYEDAGLKPISGDVAEQIVCGPFVFDVGPADGHSPAR